MDAPEVILKRSRDYGRWVAECTDPSRAAGLICCWNLFKRDATGVSEKDMQIEFEIGGSQK